MIRTQQQKHEQQQSTTSVGPPDPMTHQRPSTALITFWDGNSSLHLLNPRTAVPLVTLPQKALTPQLLLLPIRTNQIALPLLQLLFFCPENIFSRSTQSRENMPASQPQRQTQCQPQRQPQRQVQRQPAPAAVPTPAPSPTPASRSANPSASQPQRQPQR